jgi:uncharacterized protein YciI
MLFAITCLDKPDSLELRLATRPSHVDYLAANNLVLAGPLLDDAGKPCGSLLLIEAADHAAAAVFAADDPYAQAGLFASTTIRPYRIVFKDGVAI